MKKSVILLSFFSITMLFSCNKQTQYSAPYAEEGAVQEVLEQQDVDKMVTLINEVSSCLDSIQIQEKMIFEYKEGVTDNEKILIQVRSLKDLLARKQAQINALNGKFSDSEKESAQNLQKMVDFINDQLTEKTEKMGMLEEALQNKDTKIDELRYGITQLRKETEYLKEQNYQQDRQLNAVYYVVGTKKELKAMGLLKSTASKKILTENLDKSKFKRADKRGLKTIPLNKKKAIILTNNPASSYTITTGADGKSVLTITDKEKFWGASPYLIIQE